MSSQSDKLILFLFDYGPALVRRLMVRHWGSRDSAITSVLVASAIQDLDLEVRLAALEVIATYRRHQDQDLLVQALRDAHVRVRAAAAHALAQCQTIQVGNFLQEALGDPHPDVRTAAALALGQVPTLQFSSPLERLLTDQDAQVRAAAALSLGRVGRTEARIPLQAMAARDPDHRNRQIARQAIETVQKRAAGAAEKRHQAGVELIQILKDPRRSWGERQRARAALTRIGTESLIPDLDQALRGSQEDQVRVAVVEILAALPWCQRLQATLLGYLHHVATVVRRRAIVAVGDVGDRGAVFYLDEVAREGDQPGQVLTSEDARLAREAIQKINRRTP